MPNHPAKMAQPGGLLQAPQRPKFKPDPFSSIALADKLGARNVMQQQQRSVGTRGANSEGAMLGDIVGANPNIMNALGGQDGSQFFMEAAANLMMTDPDLADDIKGRARALDLQSKQMMKLMQIGKSMGEDVSPLGPIADQLQKQRDKVFRELIGKANVPTSASKPARPTINKPRM